MLTPTRERHDFEPGYRFGSYAERQKLYLDQQTGWLIPGAELYEGGRLQMQVNAYGCKGPDIEEGKPVVAFFGDSATMGHSLDPDSWPMHVGLDGYAVLNAAIEGANMARMVLRYRKLQETVQPDTVVVYCGWHNLIYGETGEAYWESQLRQFLGARVNAFCTIASCLNDAFRTRPFEPLLNRAAIGSSVGSAADAAALDQDYFSFWSDLEPTLAQVTDILDGIERYNAFLRRFCAETGSTLIDLDALLRPERFEDAPNDFFDVCHPRPRTYGRIGAFVAEALNPALNSAPRVRPPGAQTAVPAFAAPLAASVADATNQPKAPNPGDLKNNVYPLW